MDKQMRHQNELQVNCERVQEEMITANKFLNKKEVQEKHILL